VLTRAQSPMAYDSALRTARRAFDIAAARGYACDLLDIGGGYPGGAPDDLLSFSDIAALVGPLLDELFPKQVCVSACDG
jgi:ornithine decarboxylase